MVHIPVYIPDVMHNLKVQVHTIGFWYSFQNGKKNMKQKVSTHVHFKMDLEIYCVDHQLSSKSFPCMNLYRT